MKQFYSKIAGVSHPNKDGTSRQEYIRKYCKTGIYLVLRPEPDNPHDPTATAVFVRTEKGDLQIGYVTSEANRDVSEALTAHDMVSARVSELTGNTADKKTTGANIQIVIGEQDKAAVNPAPIKTPNTLIWVGGCSLVALILCLIIYLISYIGTAQKNAANQARCLPASQAQIYLINSAVNDIQASNSVKWGWYVKSNDFGQVNMVAARVFGPGMDNGSPPAVWAIGGTADQPGLMFSVNSYAKEFSGMGDAGSLRDPITLTSDGVQAAIWCVEHSK